ncbi:hypothetical protein Xoosp13_120 [Xanthomonas phage Xoo-sp13]|nr:hypothetical protein Xoosp13_120 [Xanthomonas phage Xoo-sp13]
MNLPRQTNRYYNDKGEVGYIVSPGYGVGWFSQNGDTYPDCGTDPTLIRMVLNVWDWIKANEDVLAHAEKRNWDSAKHPELKRRYIEIINYANTKWPDAYWSAHELCVQWGRPGYLVAFEEFDGNESAYSYKTEDMVL